MKELNISVIKNWIPKKCFEISFIKSFLYLGKDLLCTSIGMFFINYSYNLAINFILKLFMIIFFQFFTGTFLLAIFVIGHDCGHHLFSTNKFLNYFFGELTHSLILLTPYHQWKSSHLQHHLHHNHFSKDFSHKNILLSEKIHRLKNPYYYLGYKLRYIYPIIAWPMYLYIGIPDGSHVIPSGRLRGHTSLKRSLFSTTISVITIMSLLYHFNIYTIIMVYFIPWLIQGWLLFTITHLQHNSHNQKIFVQNWNFLDGAFETIDRDYGGVINALSHHVTDCHMVHHLFFNKIPHYQTKLATKHIVKKLEENGMLDIYKYKKTYNFYTLIFTEFSKYWHFVDNSQIS